jgi:hypothetical protein
MNRDDNYSFVAPRPTGFNGLPDIEDLGEDVAREVLGIDTTAAPKRRGAELAAWGALAAVILGAAYAGRALLARSGARRQRRDARPGAADHSITPPHGDKLLPRQRQRSQMFYDAN